MVNRSPSFPRLLLFPAVGYLFPDELLGLGCVHGFLSYLRCALTNVSANAAVRNIVL